MNDEGYHTHRKLIGKGRRSTLFEQDLQEMHLFKQMAVKNYIKTYFPGTDPEAVFSSFYWKITALPPDIMSVLSLQRVHRYSLSNPMFPPTLLAKKDHRAHSM
ncbi:unnamed protein product [Sphenostylis stenocarpa]|uniref:DUF7081 domain-containing protein n=1 Tax=Sphenostylis stenocarpa TaxID=92480 RepID=A0AA86SVN3_9FABA|nr:unnamed protein product [Sphenostylis stenocarpa]CAJ1971705.1 unnamed protein product [Sphenostylis stenocarpa]